MMQIKKIGIKQTAKFFASFYFFISLIFVLPIAILTLVVGSTLNQKITFIPSAFGGILLLLVPFIYALIGYFIVTLISFLYNIVAKRVGGVEIELGSETKIEKEENIKNADKPIPDNNTLQSTP